MKIPVEIDDAAGFMLWHVMDDCVPGTGGKWLCGEYADDHGGRFYPDTTEADVWVDGTCAFFVGDTPQEAINKWAKGRAA